MLNTKKFLIGKTHYVIVASLVFYILVLAMVWVTRTRAAKESTIQLLEWAEKNFQVTLDDEIDLELRFAGMMLKEALHDTCTVLPMEDMVTFAKNYGLDEINVVDANGITVASNLPEILGADFKATPITEGFMLLLEKDHTSFSQPFRHGVENPEAYCKYYGMDFSDKSGFIQVGISYEHFVEQMSLYSEFELDSILEDWKYVGGGWYERCKDPDDFVAGKIFKSMTDEGPAFGRYFTLFGRQFAAILPKKHFFSQRNTAFTLVAATLGFFSLFFIFFLWRLEKSSLKLEKMHQLAEERNAADLELANKIQTSTLPTPDGEFMDRLEFKLRALCQPAREVGGDFYDFFTTPFGRIAIIIADVAGKGIPAAMFTMVAKSVLRNALQSISEPAEAVTRANRQLCEENDAEMFVTAWIGLLNPFNGEVEYVNAGHNRPFLSHADGTIEKVAGKGGRFLGMFENVNYCSHFVTLTKGDRLYLYTDGIPEAMNEDKKCFGEERFSRAIQNRTVAEELTNFIGNAEQSDDLTAMTLDWFGDVKHAERTFLCGEAAYADVQNFVRDSLQNVSRKTAATILNAVDEVVTNIVSYSQAPNFRVQVDCGETRAKITFSDAGIAYNPLNHVAQDVHAPIEKRPIGGLGLVIVRSLIHRVSYQRVDDTNILTLIQNLV